jgi:hypothetical protein
MPSILGRVFLLLLLVTDWAGDPFFGQLPSSRPLASSEVYCHSLNAAASLTWQLAEAPFLPLGLPTAALVLVPRLQPLLDTACPATPCNADRVYALRSLRR